MLLIVSTDKHTGGLKKQASQSASDSEGGDSDKPLLHFSEKDTVVSYKSGGKKKQIKTVRALLPRLAQNLCSVLRKKSMP